MVVAAGAGHRQPQKRLAELKQAYQDNRDAIQTFLSEYQLHNFSIYVKELEPGSPYLFKYFEYIAVVERTIRTIKDEWARRIKSSGRKTVVILVLKLIFLGSFCEVCPAALGHVVPNPLFPQVDALLFEVS